MSKFNRILLSISISILIVGSWRFTIYLVAEDAKTLDVCDKNGGVKTVSVGENMEISCNNGSVFSINITQIKSNLEK